MHVHARATLGGRGPSLCVCVCVSPCKRFIESLYCINAPNGSGLFKNAAATFLCPPPSRRVQSDSSMNEPLEPLEPLKPLEPLEPSHHSRSTRGVGGRGGL